MASPKYIRQKNGPTLGFVDVPVIEQDGLLFKDMERTGALLPYEDWRLTPEDRAKDLASRLSVEEIAGLMMYSPHQMIPATPERSFWPASYGGKPFAESGMPPWALSDQQKALLSDNHLRYVLAVTYQDADTAARWNNELQSFCERMPHCIPVNVSSDPRHSAADANAEYKTAGSDVSRWPDGLAMAATFDPSLCREYARVIAEEYRALGISTALSPQVDLASDPRWMRGSDTFGVHPQLVTDMARAYCEGLQNDPEAKGWGMTSVAAMAKHWPGGGPCEGGRDAHYPFGRYAVYPGGQSAVHMKPFLEGAFDLPGGTKQAAAVMPYYTVSWGLDPSGTNVGNSYSRYIIGDLLRKKYGYEGVVCTDWSITGDPLPEIDSFSSRSYGVEHLTVAERHLRIIENGVDQFGGNSDIIPVLEAYRMGCKRHGEQAMRRRFEQSAVRLLLNSFRCGLFENPYLDPQTSTAFVGCEANCQAGFAAQLRSVVMLKNSGELPIRERKRVYVPGRHIGPRKSFMRTMIPEQNLPGVDRAFIERWFDWAETPEEADFALCFIESPLTDGGYNEGYKPISLQYRPYTADTARAHSIASGDPREPNPDRTYRGQTCVAANESDLDLVLNTRAAMPGKPVVVVVRMHNPCVLSELETAADAILVDFGVQKEALLTLLTGGAEPQGLLPVQLPADMFTVEAHSEDVPLDMIPYTDSVGNTYDFGFGLNWAGVIRDERTEKYHR